METASGKKIVIIGCGNVAWHLAKHLQSLKKYTLFVYNHKTNDALNDFRSTLKCNIAVGLENVIHDADYYFICVSDKHISETAERLEINNPKAILMHTSGSMKLRELGKRLHGTAVFYPLQTFSKQDTIHWQEVPVILETSAADVETKLLLLAKEFTHTIQVLDYEERLTLHLAAVLVNNFTNALYVAASELVGEKKENLSILLPLIKQTTRKLEKIAPVDAQTGPARRKDEVVMKKHLSLLAKQPALKKLYKQLSKLIVHQQENKHA